MKGEKKMAGQRHCLDSKALWGVVISFILAVTPCMASEDPIKFPSKPVTLIVPWGVGGSTDLSCRKVADLAGKFLGQPVVVVNKAGGGGVIGQSAGAKADPDGYTIVSFTHSSSVIVPHLRSVPYDIKKDFTYIMQYGAYSFIFAVLANSPWKNFKDFVEEARKKPGQMKYSSSGPLSGQHIFMEQVFAVEKVKLNHIPTSGGNEATTQVLGGHLDGAITPDFIPHIKAGKVRGLGVQSGKRFDWTPEIPTFDDLGYKLPAVNWMGICGPAGMHPVVSKKLGDAFRKAYEDPSFRDSMTASFLPIVYRDSESFKAMVFQDYDSMGKALKELNLVK